MCSVLQDCQYQKGRGTLAEVDHHYGSQVHLLSNSYLFSLLARLCHPDTHQPLVNQLVTTLYRGLVEAVIQQELPRKTVEVETRMASVHPEGRFQAEVVEPSTQVVCVNLARAGTLPSAICFDAFNYILDPSGVRQDHIAIARKTNNENQVVGTDLGGVKIGGDVDNRFVLFPIPWGPRAPPWIPPWNCTEPGERRPATSPCT